MDVPVEHGSQSLRTALAHQVSQGIAIEYRQESLKGVLKHTLQLTNRSDDAGIRLHVEAFDNGKICLRRANDVTNANLRRIVCKNGAAIAARCHCYVSRLIEPLNDAHEMMSRD